MSDRFYNDIELPDISGTVNTPESGFGSLYFKNGILTFKNSLGQETVVQQEQQVTTQLLVDGGSAATTFSNYLLRLDFGTNGASINPTGTV